MTGTRTDSPDEGKYAETETEVDLSRRSLMVSGGAAAAAAAVGLSGCGGGGEGGAQASGPLRVTMVNHVWTDNIKNDLGTFEQQNNCKIEVTQLAEDQLSAQYNTKLNAGSSEIDVMMYRPLQEGKLFAKNKYLMDLTTKVKDKDFAWDDFQDGPVNAVTYKDRIIGVPLITEREVLYYRKDILEKHGIPVPKTLDELEAAAKKVKATGSETAGFIARTDKSAAVTQFSSFLYSMGGDWVTKDGKASVNTEEAKKAYALYGRLIKDHGPSTVSTSMSWQQAMAIFTQGGAAFYTEADSLYKNSTDPSKSKVSDKVGFAVFPAGKAGSKPYNIPSWALAINEGSKSKDLAWKFILWAAGKEMVASQQKQGLPGPRKSVWDSPDGTSGFPSDLAQAVKQSLKDGVGHDRPEVLQVGKAREIVGLPIVDGITGKDTAAAADKAQTDFQKFLDEENK